MAKDVLITPASGIIEFKDTGVLKGSVYESNGDLYIDPESGVIVIGDGTPTDIQVGAVGTPVSLSFLGGGTLSSGGTSLAIGASGDTVNLNVSGVTYNFPTTLVRTSDYTAADVLNKIKTVDGSGSGLDADLLDGLNSATANTASTIVARDASGNFSAGTITAALTGTASLATSLAGGSAGTIPYQSAAGTTAMLAAGTSGYFLKSNGTSAPSWTFLSLSDLPDAWAKKSVRAATTANITLSGTQTIDGIAVVAGDRVLVKNQSSAATNGIYVVAAGAWSRATDADTISELAGALVNVDSGTANGGLRFDTDLKSTDTLGTTAVNFYKVYDANDAATANTASKLVLRDASGNFSAGTITAALTGNASTATTLQTARTINGTSFNGSANITITANTTNSHVIKFDTGTTEGTDLYTFNGSVAKTVDIKAGTNITLTKTAGVVTISANDSDVTLGTDTTGNYVASVATTSPLSGGAAGSEGATLTLSLASGYGDTQNPYASKTANYFLAAPNSTAGAPTFRAIVAADIPTLNQNTTGTAALATNKTAGAANQILYQTAANTTEFITAPTVAATSLTWNGSSFVWSAASSAGFIRKTANYTAAKSDNIVADTSGGTFTISLPATPTLGDAIVIVDGGNWKTNNLTVARNGSTIEGVAEDLIVDVPSIRLDIVYDGTTWNVTSSAGTAELPSRTGNSGKFLTTDGTNVSWAAVDALPSQTGNSGKYLTTDGSTASWATVSLPAGQTAGSATSGYLQYAGTTKTSGQLYGGTSAPSNNTRLNYDGDLYATKFYGDGTGLTGVGGFSSTDDTTTDTTYYPVFVTTAGGSTAKTSSTKLTFNPSTGTLGATVFNSLSDASLKENVLTLQNALDVVDKLNPVSFTWKDNGQKSYGVIAQEIEQVMPEIVSESNGIKSVSYDQIIPFLIQSIKELKEELDLLKGSK